MNNVQAANNLTGDQVPSGNGFIDPRKKVVCLICGGPHAKLYNCKRLPLYIPGDNFKFLPKAVCKLCLYCASNVKPPNCHKGTESFICSSSKVNKLICVKCPIVHTDFQQFFKSHHNPNLSIKQNLDLFQQ